MVPTTRYNRLVAARIGLLPIWTPADRARLKESGRWIADFCEGLREAD